MRDQTPYTARYGAASWGRGLVRCGIGVPGRCAVLGDGPELDAAARSVDDWEAGISRRAEQAAALARRVREVSGSGRASLRHTPHGWTRWPARSSWPGRRVRRCGWTRVPTASCA